METRRIIQASTEYIDEHLKEHLSVESLADRSGFSPYHFCRLFSLYMDMPVMEYVRRRRLTRGAEEIYEGRRILDVALDYGFESHNGFTKAFRKVYGYPPDEYRRRVYPHRPVAPNPLSARKAERFVQPKVQIREQEGFYVAGVVIKTSSELVSISRQPAVWQNRWLAETENKIYAAARPKEHGEYYISFPVEPGLYRLVTCVKIEDPETVDGGLYVDRVPAGRYGIFSTPPMEDDFAQCVADTWRYVFDVWLPDSDYVLEPGGLDYEFYDERCHGAPYSMDICIPLLRKGEESGHV